MTPAHERWSELTAAFRLAGVPGLGAVNIAKARRSFASAAAALAASPEAWRAADLPERVYTSLVAARRADVTALVAGVQRSGGWAVSIFDADYPELLRHIHDPPPLLYGRGDLAALREPCVAVVGSRRASRYGTEHGHRVARGLAASGVTVVSGLAVGIDAAAHIAALEAGGRTAAVLGSGFANVYPRGHAALAERICERGVLVGELPPGEAADRVNFPRRNRIISGLCRAVVVLEARLDSGSLITAREALDQGREVFVVPGPAGGANRGGHKLLFEGAGWCEDADDVLRSLGRRAQPKVAAPAQAVPENWRPVWSAVEGSPVHIDRIIAASGLRTSEVLGILLQLELQGRVRQLPNKHFVRML